MLNGIYYGIALAASIAGIILTLRTRGKSGVQPCIVPKIDTAPQPTTHDRIALLAYELWEIRQQKGFPGTEMDDWLFAETLMLHRKE